MKVIEVIQKMPGRPEFKVGGTYSFNGPIEESYANKYIERGWARDVTPAPAPAAATPAAQTGEGADDKKGGKKTPAAQTQPQTGAAGAQS